MKVICTSKEMIVGALNFVNTKFSDNIAFRKWEPINKKGTSFTVRLTVEDSRGPGARVSPHGRRIKTACWHVTGHFCAYLLERGAKIRAMGGVKYDSPADNWKGDHNMGSVFYPVALSDLCDCGEERA